MGRLYRRRQADRLRTILTFVQWLWDFMYYGTNFSLSHHVFANGI